MFLSVRLDYVNRCLKNRLVAKEPQSENKTVSDSMRGILYSSIFNHIVHPTNVCTMLPQRFKRHYSRGGCRECKRRKIKCDEAKPDCSECSRLGKECSYPQIGEKVVRGSGKENGEKKPRYRRKVWNFQMYMGPENPRKMMKWDSSFSVGNVNESGSENNNNSHQIHDGEFKNGDSLEVHNVEFKDESAHQVFGGRIKNENPHQIQDDNLQNLDDKLNSSSNHQEANVVPRSKDSVSPSSLWSGDLYNGEDLNLLATDLNNLVNEIMFNSNIVPNTNSGQAMTDLDPGIMSCLYDLPTDISDYYTIGKTDEERRYIRQFCERFTLQKLPFGVDNNNSGSYRNAIREVVMLHAVKEPFLLAAVLSQGAYSASESQTDDKLCQQDLENCGKYLNNCLQLLVPALNQTHKKQVKGDLTSNIENILLTVLSLAMSNACNEKQSWRPHLEGAKEIIMKATSSKIRLSRTLIVCKMWFADFEVLAGLSSELGGTLRTKEQMDLVFHFDSYEQSVLKDFGLILDNGFCVVTGYHIECLEYFRELCDLLRRKRSNSEEQPDPLEYMYLISGLYFQNQIKFAQVETTSTRQFLQGPLCDTIQNSDGTFKTISWMDLSQQAFTLAGLITVFKRLLNNPPESNHLKGLVTKMIDLIKVFQECKPQDSARFPFAFLMIQWPISVAGFACTEPQQFPVIENFFEMCSQTGSNSASLTLKQIKKIWKLRETGEVMDGVDGGSVDIIAY